MADDEYLGGIPYLEDVLRKLALIRRKGFGEVRVIIRNGVIYRILSTEDELMGEKKAE